MGRAEFVEAALQRLLLAPGRELLLKLARSRRALPCSFVDRDRFLQPPRAIVQVSEPLCGCEVIRIERKRALEARLRDVILSEHERGDARAEAEARVAGLQRGSPGEGCQRVSEALTLERCRAGASKCARILRRAFV